MEKVLPYLCRCGGKLKKSFCEVEFFGIDFGLKPCEVCSKCGEEFLDDSVLEEIEKEVKKKKLFGLEKRLEVTKSGNSLVIRIPPEIAAFSKLSYKSRIRIYPSSKKRIEIEIAE